MGKMKTLYISHTFPPRVGGRESYLYNLWSRLDPQDGLVLTPKQEVWAGFDLYCPLQVQRKPKDGWMWFMHGRRARLRWLLSLSRLCVQERIHIVHCGVILPDGMSGWLLKRTFGRPYVVYTYAKEIVEPLPMKELEHDRRRALVEADRVVTISRYSRDLLIEQGVSPDRIAVIPPAVDDTRFRPTPHAGWRIRARYGLGKRPLLLTVARLLPRKGHDLVLRALPTVLEAIPDAVYMIVGDGPDQARLERLTHFLGVVGHVIFTGRLPDEDLPGCYNAADVMVMPNREEPVKGEVEGFGMVFLEANACGVPVIGGNSGGVPEAIAHGVSGYLVNPYDVTDLTWRILALLGNRTLARQMGASGRQWAQSKFSWERSARQVQTLNEEVAAQSRPVRAGPVQAARLFRFLLMQRV
jgi:phosphatidylinositol alpha-1,6-mannosyltransferase